MPPSYLAWLLQDGALPPFTSPTGGTPQVPTQDAAALGDYASLGVGRGTPQLDVSTPYNPYEGLGAPGAYSLSKGPPAGTSSPNNPSGGASASQQAQAAEAARQPAAPSAGTSTAAPPNSASAATSGNAASFAQHLPYAQQALQAAGWNPDLAPILLGIAANEGAFAPGTLAAAPTNNAFGIKATADWTGPTVTRPTQEVVNGQPVTQQATFRTYPTPQASYGDFIQFLQQNRRYGSAVAAQGSPTDFLQGLAQAGYATDPQWASKVLALAREAATATAPTPAGANPAGGANPAPVAGAVAQHILAEAQNWIGTPYLWAGQTPSGADCSGFIVGAAAAAGAPFPPGVRTAEQIRQVSAPVAPDQVQPGDLVFFQGTDPNLPTGTASHVGIVTEQGVMLNANDAAGSVVRGATTTPYWQQHLIGYARPPQYAGP